MTKTLFSIVLLLPISAFSQRITGKIARQGNAASYIEIIAVKDKIKQTAISNEK